MSVISGGKLSCVLNEGDSIYLWMILWGRENGVEVFTGVGLRCKGGDVLFKGESGGILEYCLREWDLSKGKRLWINMPMKNNDKLISSIWWKIEYIAN